MRTISFEIPDTIEVNDREAKMILASNLVRRGKISVGQGASFVGLSKRAFIEILSDYDTPIINYTESELDKDITNARNYSL